MGSSEKDGSPVCGEGEREKERERDLKNDVNSKINTCSGCVSAKSV